MLPERSNDRALPSPDEPRGAAPSLVLVPTDDGHRAVVDHCPTYAQRVALTELGQCGLAGFRWDPATASFAVSPWPGDPADDRTGQTAATIAFGEALALGVVPVRLGARHDAGLARRAARALAGAR